MSYRVKFTTSPQIVRGENETEEIVYGDKNYISMSKAENLVFQLNNGMEVDFNNLNS